MRPAVAVLLGLVLVAAAAVQAPAAAAAVAALDADDVRLARHGAAEQRMAPTVGAAAATTVAAGRYVLPNGVLYDPRAGLSRDHATLRTAGRGGASAGAAAAGGADATQSDDANGRNGHPFVARMRSNPRDQQPLPDDDLLRAMQLELPEADRVLGHGDYDGTSLTSLTARQSRGMDIESSVQVSGPPSAVIRGTKSIIQIWYNPGFPRSAKPAYEYGINAWANNFPCAVPIRFIVYWQSLSGSTLGATVTPFYVPGNIAGGSKFEKNTVYGGPLAAAIQGTDFVPSSEAHVLQLFNADVSWNLDPGARPSGSEWDLATVAMHEQCHGLFFSGVVDVRNREAVIGTSSGKPSRFDNFLTASSNAGVVASCSSPRDFYNAITNGGLRWADPAAERANFSLYSPTDYQPGSSIYHHDPARLRQDCVENRISTAQCSDLMTQELVNGYWQHSIGEPVLRIMQSLMSGSVGMGAGSCAVAAGTNGGNGKGGVPFKLPQWAIYAIAGVGGLFLLIIVVVAISSCFRRKRVNSSATTTDPGYP